MLPPLSLHTHSPSTYLFHTKRSTKQNSMNHHNIIPMNFQQLPHLFLQEIPTLGNSSGMKANRSIKKEEPSCAQMTIIYDGKVIVFDDVPADKAKDIMDFSTKGITSTSQNHNNNYAYSSFLARNSANNSLQDCYQVPSIPVIYDLPMTRKASLHRFLEKRKDRIAARAPYQTSNPAAFFNKPINESMSWLSLAPQSPQHKSECSSTSVLFL